MKNLKRKLVATFMVICSVGFFSFQSQNTIQQTEEMAGEISMAPTYGLRMCYVYNSNGTTSVGQWCGTAPYSGCSNIQDPCQVRRK